MSFQSKLRRKEIIIDDSTGNDVLFPKDKGRGQEPRDWKKHPLEFAGSPAEIDVIPRSEWDARIEEKEAIKSQLSDVRGRIKSMDQARAGYCWGHSVTMALMLARRMANQRHVPLSAYSVCAIIKRGRDEGGWCGLALKFMREHGIATQASWPQGSRDLSIDTPELRKLMKKYRVTSDYYDLARQEWNQEMTFDQVATCLLNNVPCALDFNWWGHSVCGLDLVKIEAGSYGIRILNSWGEQWGDRGTSVLRYSKAIPNGAVGIRAGKVAGDLAA